jgi:hypothetical protein
VPKYKQVTLASCGHAEGSASEYSCQDKRHQNYRCQVVRFENIRLKGAVQRKILFGVKQLQAIPSSPVPTRRMKSPMRRKTERNIAKEKIQKTVANASATLLLGREGAISCLRAELSLPWLSILRRPRRPIRLCPCKHFNSGQSDIHLYGNGLPGVRQACYLVSHVRSESSVPERANTFAACRAKASETAFFFLYFPLCPPVTSSTVPGPTVGSANVEKNLLSNVMYTRYSGHGHHQSPCAAPAHQ